MSAEPPQTSLHRSALPGGVSASEPLLRADGITVNFGTGTHRIAAVRDVALTLGAGEAIGIVGESGSGKSTLARVLAGLHRPDIGTLLFRGQPVYANGQAYPGDLRRQVQMVFQDPYGSLNPRMSALTAVAEACRFFDKCTSGEAKERSLRLLGTMGISAQDAVKKPRQLSGGQRQRVSIARALSARPSVLVADEPTSAIDQSAQAQLLNLFNELVSQKLAIVLISHDLAVIRYLAKRVYVMRDGEFVEAGDTLEVFDRPRHAYTQALIASIPGRKSHSPANQPPTIHGPASMLKDPSNELPTTHTLAP